MMENQQKTDLQKAVATKLTMYKYMAVLWATGLGKSFAAIRSILATGAKRILIVVNEIPHKKNWENEFRKFYELFPMEVDWAVSSKDIKIRIECYASLKKLTFTQWDMVIWDEAHHLYTEKRMDYATTIKANYMLFLSATLSRNMLARYSVLFNHPITVEEYSLQKGFDNDVLPEPKVFAIQLELDNTVQDQVFVESWGKNKVKKRITCRYQDRNLYLNNKRKYKDIELHIKCTQRQYYDYLTEKGKQYETLFKNTNLDFYRNYWMKYATMRKRFIGEWKQTFAISIIVKLLEKRFICFCASIAQASELVKIGNYSGIIHSKMTNKHNTDIIEKFNNNELMHLFAVNMLKEGQNLNNIESGIIIQLDGEIRTFIQRFGRVLRAESPEQYILYVKDTQDEKYKNESLAGIDSKYVKELTFHEFVIQNLKNEQ